MQLSELDMSQDRTTFHSTGVHTARRLSDAGLKLRQMLWSPRPADEKESVHNPLYNRVLFLLALTAIVNLFSAPFVFLPKPFDFLVILLTNLFCIGITIVVVSIVHRQPRTNLYSLEVEAKNTQEAERELLAQQVAERTAALTQANLQLAQIARHKDEFLTSVSHELRTPLNAILGTVEVMSEGVYGPLNQKQLSRLRNIEESGHHLLSLINDVLDMAKIEAGKLTLEIDNVHVKTICEASLRLIRQSALKKQQNVSLHIDPELTHLKADGRRLKQMLINLLSNAIKFTPNGGAIGIRVTQDRGERIVQFTVWDTGIGIEPEHQKRLFQPFVQIDSALTRQYDGSGLGLAIVQKMANLHGGAILLKSKPNQGSEFTIALPLSAESVENPSPLHATSAIFSMRQAVVTHTYHRAETIC